MSNITNKTVGDEEHCYHLRGIPLYWTESSLSAALEIAGISGIRMVQIMTKIVTLKSGGQLAIPNGDAVIFFKESEGRTFTNDLLIPNRSAVPVNSKGVFVHVRRLDLPMIIRDLQTALLQDLGAGDVANAAISMEVFYEWHSRTLKVREQILRMDINRFVSENPDIEGYEFEAVENTSDVTTTSLPTLKLSFKNPDLTLTRRSRRKVQKAKEFELVHFEGQVPCFKFPYNKAAEKETSTAKPQLEPENLYPERQVPCFKFPYNKADKKETSTPKPLLEPEEMITFDPDTLDLPIPTGPKINKLFSVDFHSLLDSEIPPKQSEPLTSSNGARTTVLHIQGLPYKASAIHIKSYAESIFGGAVAFCARYVSRVQGKVQGKVQSECDDMQTDAAIIFQDVKTEISCLEKRTFDITIPASRNTPSTTRTITVIRMEGEEKIADVMKAFDTLTSLRDKIHPSELRTFDMAYHNALNSSHRSLMAQLGEIKSLQKKGQKFITLKTDILDVQSDWLKRWEMSLFYGHRLLPEFDLTASLNQPLESDDVTQSSTISGQVDRLLDLKDIEVNLPVSSTSKVPHHVEVAQEFLNPELQVVPDQNMDLPLVAAQELELSAEAAENMDLPLVAAQELELPAEAAQNMDLPLAPVWNPRRRFEPTIPLYVKGVYYHWDGCTLADYFQLELGTRVKFCAIYTKVVRGEGPYANLTLKIPQGHAIIMFSTVAAQEECLNQSIFYPGGIPPLADGRRRFLKVTRYGGEDNIALVNTAADLQEAILFSMPPGDALRLQTMYEEYIFNSHVTLIDDQWHFNRLKEEEAATFTTVTENILELHEEWWEQHQDGRMD